MEVDADHGTRPDADHSPGDPSPGAAASGDLNPDDNKADLGDSSPVRCMHRGWRPRCRRSFQVASRAMRFKLSFSYTCPLQSREALQVVFHNACPAAQISPEQISRPSGPGPGQGRSASQLRVRSHGLDPRRCSRARVLRRGGQTDMALRCITGVNSRGCVEPGGSLRPVTPQAHAYRKPLSSAGKHCWAAGSQMHSRAFKLPWQVAEGPAKSPAAS